MKNKAQKNGYKHTLQKRFLTLLLVSIILASGMIGGAGIASAQRVINEDHESALRTEGERDQSDVKRDRQFGRHGLFLCFQKAFTG